jgi:hypothetical protein
MTLMAAGYIPTAWNRCAVAAAKCRPKLELGYLYSRKTFLVIGAGHPRDATRRPSLAFVSESKSFRGRLFGYLDVGMFFSSA